MRNALELVSVCQRLNEANLFAVLVYARFKFARQLAEEVKPYVRERRCALRLQQPNAHIIGRWRRDPA